MKMDKCLPVLLLGVLMLGGCSARVVTVSPGPLIRVQGQPVTIRCDVNDYGGPREQDFDWTMQREGGSGMNVISSFETSFSDASLSSRVAAGDISITRLDDNVVELRIEEVRASDGGVYSCKTPSTDSVIKGNYEAKVLLTASKNVYVTVGENVTLPLGYPLTPSHDLKWYHANIGIFYRRSGKFNEGSKEDINSEGSLKLTNVKKDNAGHYRSGVYRDGKLLNQTLFTLYVLDKIQKPTVEFSCPKSSTSSTSVTFTCKIPQQAKGLTFQWLKKQTVLERESGPTLSWSVAQLEGNDFTCKVSNPAAFEISQPVTPSCLSNTIVPEKLFGLPFWTMVGILAGGGGLVLLLIVITIVCYSRSKRKRQKHLEEEGELRLEWTNQQKQQQQQQHHHHYPQPTGRTAPRQHQANPAREPEHPRGPESSGTNPRRPRPSPRAPGQGPRPVGEREEEQPPPLPQPRKKAPKTARAKHDVNARK